MATYDDQIRDRGGWIQLILGVIIALAGFALLAGRAWGGIVAIFMAVLSAIASFFIPFWSIIIIGLCNRVIWSMTRPEAIGST